ncbi:hypothetical protein SYNPS1DRAFT_27200 [Syncephalis pseudoplumigaleata]|uniref:RxLR effector protein n=1 Tax=Syncephalis pseudoplumigaleata TaxID=1712513 RepID=A0A4P9Z3K5_9FUNG|nr:hypothetical protein SYNPS1DRAFT_27200 [Syncephalis pseudoplumigaleata]|eukprot:RKP27133.1 hypothetical protein SYNPS1DRAFT_27200 [Syncephalis pseudoplumigaleata]
MRVIAVLLALCLPLLAIDNTAAAPHSQYADSAATIPTAPSIESDCSAASHRHDHAALARRDNEEDAVKKLMGEFHSEIELIIKRVAKNQLVGSVMSEKFTHTLLGLREHKVDIDRLIDEKKKPLTGDAKENFDNYLVHIRRWLDEEKKKSKA